MPAENPDGIDPMSCVFPKNASPSGQTQTGVRPTRLNLRVAGERAFSHQVLIDAAGGFAAFPDRPYHQRLAAARVAGGEYSRHAGHEIAVALDIAALVQLQSQLRDDAVGFGPQ